MKLSIVIPLSQDDSEYVRDVLPETCDLVAPLAGRLPDPHRAGHGTLVRTWDDATGAPTAHVVLERLAADVVDGLRDAIGVAHPDWTTTLSHDDVDVLPAPHSRSGFSGPAFDRVSRDLGRKTTPIFTDLARSRPDASQAPVQLRAAQLLVTHCAATLRGAGGSTATGRDPAALLSLRLLSYRSHYEAVLLRTSDPEAFERACAAFYDQVGPELRETVRRAGDEPERRAVGAVPAAWDDLVTEVSRPIGEHVAAGTIVDAGRTLADLERELGSPVAPTRFHAPPTPHMSRLLHDDVDFLTYRVLTSVLYSGLHAAGFSLAERYVFCNAVARANEDVAGKDMLGLQDDLDALARDLAEIGSPVAPAHADAPGVSAWT